LLHTTGTDRQQSQAAKVAAPSPPAQAKPVISFNSVKAGAPGAKKAVDFIINHVPVEHR